MCTAAKIALSFLLMGGMNMLQAEDRECVVCGSFYPKEKQKLQEEIKQAFASAKSLPQKNVQAIIVPHAGYIYSADVAATAYKTLDKKYKNIFIIGSSHHINFNGVSIYNEGDYTTPLGKVKSNHTIIAKLLEKDFIVYNKKAHAQEHTIEVQLPFLQTLYQKDLQIIPIVVATSELQTIQKLVHTLKPYFTEENLFVISTDLSHFPNYTDANCVDMELLHSIEKNNIQTFIETLQDPKRHSIPNLQTSACGYSSVLTLLELTQDQPYRYELLAYKNSGDTLHGDKNRVVGYGAMRVYKNDFFISSQEKQTIKEIAKLTLYEAVIENKRATIDIKELPPLLHQHLGAFVTLYLDGKLKGCIGRFEPNQPLYEVIQDMSIAASRYDKRFTPVKAKELKNVKIEISLLSPRKKTTMQDIVIGEDGIYVEYGTKSGTYLPHVATQMGWDTEQFVKSCCKEKAGMTQEECTKATLYSYKALVF